MRKNLLAVALLLAAFATAVLGAGYPIKERFTSLIGGQILRTLPATATDDTHREAMLSGDQRILTASFNPSTSWAITHNPGVNSVATISKAAAAGKVHVIKGWSATLNAGTSAPTATYTAVVVRDGATGAGTVKASATMGIAAVAGSTAPPWTGFGADIVCTSGTAATIEFGAAAGDHTFQSVSMWGETVPYVAD